jgi:hypothetical protein
MLRRIPLVFAACALLGWFPAAASADSCPNEQLRAENNSLKLPDCRAYEMVSPQDKNGSDVSLAGSSNAAVSGAALAYESTGAFAGARGAGLIDEYISRWGAGGWTTEGIIPYLTPNLGLGAAAPGYWAFTPELTQGVLSTYHTPDEITGDTSQDQPRLYLRTASGAYSAITPAVSPAPSIYEHPWYMGASSDLSRVFFESSFSLTPDAPPVGVPELYEWVDGHIQVVGVMPDGSVSANGVNPAVGLGDYYYSLRLTGHMINPERGISPDGTQALFASGSPSQLYLRQDGASTTEPSTTEISLSQKAGSVGSPAPDGVSFAGTASADGQKISTVFFTSHDELTDDANTGSSAQGNDLYAYDVATGSLRDLTPDSNPADPNGASVESPFGQVFVAADADGSYVYFEATGQLAPGAPVNGEDLYVWHNGAITYVGPVDLQTMSPEDFQVSKDGQRVTYDTSLRLTTDDPGTDQEGHGLPQVYVYDAPSATWTCVSCLHGATTPAAGTFKGFLAVAGFEPRHVQRNISDDGRRVFFQTATPLVPQDTNGQADVYEWEDGVVRLLSSGRSSEGANLLGASASGDDVFIATRERLVAADQDNNIDAYDVRVGGGFPAAVVSRVSSCEGDLCQGPIAAPPGAPTPASESLNGSGNVSAPVVKPAVKPTRAQGLARALKACRKRHGRRRRKCESEARKRYGYTRASKSGRSR